MPDTMRAPAEEAPLAARLTATFAPTDRKATRIALDRLVGRADAATRAELELLLAEPAVAGLLEGVFGTSSYLTTLAVQDPTRLVRILTTPPEALIDALVGRAAYRPGEDEAALMRRLRLVKQEAALALGLADLGGALDVMDVTAALTRIADATLDTALSYALAESAERGRLTLADPAVPTRDCGLIVLAMGKQGAFELNYSSDIDLIVLFDVRRARLADPSEAVETFVRVVKRLGRILQERTADGYVFRVDLRLRPDPGATPPAMSIDAAFTYYESMGQNWERAALIKARAAAGDIPAGESFLKEIASFIWRRSFDFAAIADVHSIKRQIHAHKGHDAIAVLGHNVKLGRGGIREVEFFVQTQQLIAGGRDPSLRGRSTLEMLRVLAERGWIGIRARDEMTEAYRFLRNVEHRIQMVADEQSHVVPADPKAAERIARMMGFAGLAAFSKALEKRLMTVQGHYARLFEHAPQLSSGSGNLVFTGGDDDPGTIATLKGLGYKRPEDVTAAIRAWHFGRYPAMRSSVARERLTEITPALVEAIAATKNADAAFLAFDRLVARLPAGVQLFSLLASKPDLLKLIAEIVGSAPKLADVLTRRPRVIDALSDPAFFAELPDEAELGERLRVFLAEGDDYEERLDRARIFTQEQLFLIGVRAMSGTLSPTLAGEAYARLAGVLVARLFEVVEAEFALSHGHVPGAAAAVVAMGKLGGRDMTAASDLDLMLLYRLGTDEMSDGGKPLMGAQYYARLTQRLIAALSAPTAEGLCYPVDFRLRPSGNKGPLATEIDGFRQYHAKEAWTWEHMALTRARVVAGDADLAGEIERAIAEVLARPRDAGKIRADVAEMRRLIADEKGTDDPWNIKQVAGGLVDIEFIAQGLALAGGALAGQTAANTADLLRHLAALHVLSAAEAKVLLPALDLYQTLTQVLRLAIDGPFRPAEAPAGLIDRLCNAARQPNLKRLTALLAERQKAVRAIFAARIG
jgi:glutamate-ammonia-ligase adenylyltransferase